MRFKEITHVFPFFFKPTQIPLKVVQTFDSKCNTLNFTNCKSMFNVFLVLFNNVIDWDELRYYVNYPCMICLIWMLSYVEFY